MMCVEFQIHSVKAVWQLEVRFLAFSTDEFFQVFGLCPFAKFRHFNQSDSVHGAELASPSVVFLLFTEAIGCICFCLVAKSAGLIVLLAVMFNGQLKSFAVGVEMQRTTTDTTNISKRSFFERHAKKLFSRGAAYALGQSFTTIRAERAALLDVGIWSREVVAFVTFPLGWLIHRRRHSYKTAPMNSCELVIVL